MSNGKRKLGLSILVVLLVFSNSFGTYKLIIDTEKFISIYPDFSLTQIKFIAIIPIMTILSLIAIWFGKMWGLYLTIITFSAIFFLDIYSKFWQHALLASVSFLVLLYFCWTSKNHFARQQSVT
ncbi:MAG: hypothetical protein V9E90_13445 [Saprospiraceae bacterium]|jgi:hypothetical protein